MAVSDKNYDYMFGIAKSGLHRRRRPGDTVILVIALLLLLIWALFS
jgi:hypothetical protein